MPPREGGGGHEQWKLHKIGQCVHFSEQNFVNELSREEYQEDLERVHVQYPYPYGQAAPGVVGSCGPK